MVEQLEAVVRSAVLSVLDSVFVLDGVFVLDCVSDDACVKCQGPVKFRFSRRCAVPVL